MRLKKLILFLFPVLLICSLASAKDALMVRNLQPQKGVDQQTAEALSDIIKSTLGDYYSVQSMDALAALSSVVEEKLKAGCDDTKCLIEVAGAMDIGLVATGSISKLGNLYTLNMQLISTRGANLGVIQRASDKCECSEQELVELSERVALNLIGKTPAPAAVASPQRSPAAAPPVATSSSVEERFTNSIGQNFVYIKPGSFMMGSPESEPGRFDNERQHQVTLTRGYYMQTTEVTQGQWRTVMGSNPSKFSNCGDICPVEKVSWDDCQEFIRKLNQKEGTSKYRLPTEAEWEYAARAGTTGPFAFGSCLSTDQANYRGYIPLAGCPKGQFRKKLVMVGSFSPNPWGLYDMHGNVWEWCQDGYDDYPTGNHTDPIGPPSGSRRVRRGGSWGMDASRCRSAHRTYIKPASRDADLGFRLVAEQ